MTTASILTIQWQSIILGGETGVFAKERDKNIEEWGVIGVISLGFLRSYGNVRIN